MSKSREKLLILTMVVFVASVMAFLAYLMHLRARESNRAPIITCATPELHVSVNAAKEDLLAGVTAMDAEDGDLTSKVLVGSISSFMEKGKCEITYTVFDSSNRAATAKRTLYYTDYHSPRFALSDDLIFYSGETANPLRLVSAYDCIDGDVTNRISMTWLDSEGNTKRVRFRVVNSYGDVSVLTANVANEEKATQNTPVIRLKEYVTYIERGEAPDPLDFITSITVARNVYSKEEFGTEHIYYNAGDFDSSAPGTYIIEIFCENEENVGSTELIVVVE